MFIMTTLEEKFLNFQYENELSDDAMKKLLVIFNESFIELAHKLLNTKDISNQANSDKKIKTKGGDSYKKWATKIAAEYAEDNSLTLEDFDFEGKITKKHIDDAIKKKNIPVKKNKEDVNIVEKKSSKKCAGLNNNGCPCGKPATEKPEGSSSMYCFRHAMEWKNFEVSSDSELEEEDFIK